MDLVGLEAGDGFGEFRRHDARRQIGAGERSVNLYVVEIIRKNVTLNALSP